MHELLTHAAKLGGLVLFVAAFVLVLIYAFAPGSRERFERARRAPLEDLPLIDEIDHERA